MGAPLELIHGRGRHRHLRRIGRHLRQAPDRNPLRDGQNRPTRRHRFGQVDPQARVRHHPQRLAEATNAILENAKNVGAKSASGSAKIDAVVICPCSGTIIGSWLGISDNLVTRSAIVAMKERRKLIIVPEAPYATVHLENIANFPSGAPSSFPPPRAHNHNDIDDMVDFIIARILDRWATSTTSGDDGPVMKSKMTQNRRLLQQGSRGNHR